MRTLGLAHRIETNGAVTSLSIEADSTSPALEVLCSVFGQELQYEDLEAGNSVPDGDLMTISWGRWQSLNPITVIGANMLRTVDDTAVHPGRAQLAAVTVIAGPDSGFRLDLDPRRARLSRLPHDQSLTVIDPCISRTPQFLELNAANGQGVSILGATVLAPSVPPTPEPAPQIRSPPTSRADDIHIAPTTVDDPRPARPPQWWTFLIPIGIGVVLALATGMWWFLLFSVSAPLSGYVAYLVEKRRFTRDVEHCRRGRAAAAADARARLHELITAHRRSAFTAPGLRLGFGPVLSGLTVDEQLQEGTDHVDGRIVLDAVPICIDPRTTTVTVTGDPAVLATMAFAWLSDRRYTWSPGPELSQLPELAGTRFSADLAQSSALPLGRAGHDADETITVRLDDTAEQGTLTMSGPRPASAISISVGTLAQARTLTSTAPRGPVPHRALTASLMPAARFVTLHRSRQKAQSSPPWPSHGLGELCDDTPEAIATRWLHPTPNPVMIGRGTDGDIGIDLFADGPHALVAGTTGSGKSLLLQTWLLSMALAQPPRRLQFVLIDFKGGATFAPLQDLPHTDSVLDDFDSGLAFRALVSVRAEITRRERLLAEHGCADVEELADPPPRLVVVIDEFHALMATHPRAADLLEHLTALGRSLGVHLILATQRPLGVVTGQMKANINIRVCLRVREETDSFDVIGTEAGALLPADKPGAACLDTGIGTARFRVAVPFGTDSLTEAARRPRVRPWVRGPLPSLAGGARGVSVANIISAAGDSADRSGASADQSEMRHVVHPPLPGPDDMTFGQGSEAVGQVSGTAGQESAAATGIIDLPTEQRQKNWSFDPDADGSTILTGGDPAIADSVLVSMARSAASTHRIIAVGRIAGLLEWAEITCGMNDGWRLQAVLGHLAAGSGAQARSGLSSGLNSVSNRQPPSLLVCGNWAELVDSLDHYWAERLERLLGHAGASGLRFLLAGCRNMTFRNSLFATQIIFPPETGEDGTNVGLSRQRFAGTWPDYRAVIRGPTVQACGGEGADVQLVPGDASSHDSSGAVRPTGEHNGFAPRWRGLDRQAGTPCAVADPDRVPIGVDPFGELVTWDPRRDGSVLTVRGSPQSGKSEFAALMAQLGNAAVHDDAHSESEPVDWDLLDGNRHVLTVPTRFAPGYGSPLAKAQSLGPLLVLGSHTRQDLTGLGLLRQAPLDGLPGTGWLVTEDEARPVRVFTTEGS
ncbi:FtsK/SpoIIIE domain-containing protein [Brevibacterium spongiae]|uniref:FtsK domain-containing protein n=1 Tax=Brevibacterium spongiae TaxID=2909672 RepID=A0ABY5SPU0_9MICO|nr:FtsK/SpoIIIE domain-containing protein [Brevibacterium spongiae]UVI35094.1 hypothetical protein L1F31_13345 [Brevibacterium spongiae]